ncbi:putative Red chlorophyll catabolite reductase [Helianthus anomalus]
MAAVALHFPSLSPSLRYLPSAYPPKAHARFSCSSSASPQNAISTNFMDFPYVSPSHKDLMVDLASTLDTRLSSFLNPCNLPPDVQSYQNETGTAHAALHLRSGVQSSPVLQFPLFNVHETEKKII